jgi:DNA-binding XRE family transcriptional regulator/mannose-6-phosphate isomerase-like protein (cupin superfamily)
VDKNGRRCGQPGVLCPARGQLGSTAAAGSSGVRSLAAGGGSAAGVSASFVSQLENGKSQPSVATLYSLSQLLNISIDRLFQSEGVASSPVVGVTAAAEGPTDVPAVEQITTSPRRRRLGEVPISRAELGSSADAWPQERSLERLSVLRLGHRPRLVMDSGAVWEQLARNTGSSLDFIEIIYPPGSSSTNDDRMLRHDGYEHGYLMQGELEVTYGFEVFTLHTGESLGLESSVPHLLKNPGIIAARGIWCVHHERP